MSKKNLLVFTNGFPDNKDGRYNCQFVFEYTNLVKEYFDRVFVISPQPIFPKWLANIPALKKFGRFANFQDYKKDNIQVYYPKFFTLPFPIFRGKNHSAFLKCAEKTIRSNRLHFDCIHAHFISPTGTAALKLKKEYRKRLILTPHGGDIYSWPFESAKNLSEAKSVLMGADTITANSNMTYYHIKKISPEVLNKTIRISNFVDTSKFNIADKKTCREKLGLPANKQILLNVANLTDGKGHMDLLEAFTRLENNAGMVLYLVGTGELQEAIKSQIDRLGLADRVILIGPIANESLPLWYGAADLFVFPSHFESFGIVQVEALACGLPVVAYANSGSKEILKNSSLGLISPIGDIKRLADNIELGIKTKWQSKNLRDFAIKEYSSTAVRDKLLSAYQS